MALTDDLLAQLGSGGAAQLAQAIGADEGAMGGMIKAALPAILGGMANNTKSPQGAAALSSALDNHDDSVFGNLGSILDGADGNAILGHVLGQKREPVQQQLAKDGGFDVGMITKLLPLLAPLVMGYLSKQKKANNLDDAGVGAMVQNGRKEAEASQPGLGGLLSILDSDGDGSIVDDVMGMAAGAGGGSSSGGGGLGGLLGKLLRR